MDVDDVSQLLKSNFEIHQRSHFLYDSSGIGSHDMASDDLGIGLLVVTDDLYKPLGGLYGLRFTIATVEAFVGGIVWVLGFN